MRFDPAITVLGMKKQIASVYSAAMADFESDEVLNSSIEIRYLDNLPLIKQKSRYGYGMSESKAPCEYCSGHIGKNKICKLKPEFLEGGDANDFELSQKVTLAYLYNSQKYPRKMALSVIFMPESKIERQLLCDNRDKHKQTPEGYFAGEDPNVKTGKSMK